MELQTSKCPFCAEEIKSTALLCRHCGETLPGNEEDIALLRAKSARPKLRLPRPFLQVVFKSGDNRDQKTPWQAAAPFGLVAALVIGMFMIMAMPLVLSSGSGRLGFLLMAVITSGLFYFAFRLVVTLVITAMQKRPVLLLIPLSFILLLFITLLILQNFS